MKMCMTGQDILEKVCLPQKLGKLNNSNDFKEKFGQQFSLNLFYDKDFFTRCT